MEERIKIKPCKKCGGRGLIFQDNDNMRRPYYLKCEECGSKSKYYLHIDTAIMDWNEINKPEVAKVKYHCGNCGAEVILGFDVCTKCGTQIDWN